MLTVRLKRRLTYVTIAVFFLLGGIEYAVILPTVWLYLTERFNASSRWLGLVMSAFSVADMLASPLIGRWADKTHNTRMIVLVANIPQFIGSVMYFLGISPWFLVASRFVVGLGSGACAALLADIARVTSREERTSTFSLFMSCRQLGLIIGPGCNLFLMHINFYLGPFHVDSYTVPGLFMAFLWVIHEFLTIFMFWNLSALRVQEQVEQSCTLPYSSSEYQIPDGDAVTAPSDTNPPSFNSVDFRSEFDSSQELPANPNLPESASNEGLRSCPLLASEGSSEFASSNDYMEVAEKYMGEFLPRRYSSAPSFDAVYQHRGSTASRPLSAGASAALDQSLVTTAYGTMGLPAVGQLDQGPVEPQVTGDLPNSVLPHANGPWTAAGWSLSYYVSEFLRDQIIAILATVFVGYFNQVSLETMATPLMRNLLGWGELENSIFYFAAGIQIIIVFLLILPLSRRFADRWLLLWGFILETIAIVIFLAFVPPAKPMDFARNLPVMIVGIFIDLVGLPVLVVSSTSLYSKITRQETQGFAQGLRRVFAQWGMILGPLWAGSMLDRPYWMFGVMLGVNLFATCLLILSFKRLHGNVSEPTVIHKHSGETEPLIS